MPAKNNPTSIEGGFSRFLSRLALVGTGKGRETLVENISMLVASGMDMLSVLRAVKDEVKNAALKKMIDRMVRDVEGGAPLWQTFHDSGLFAPPVIALLKIGEQSGRLTENLSVIAKTQEKESSFRSKIRSAMLYPVFVLVLAAVIAIGIAWFILPNLTTVFGQLNMELPFLTRLLIGFGGFLTVYGSIAIPFFFITMILGIYVVFIFSKTRWIGQHLLFATPGIRRLIREVELSRMGYIVSSLLSAGLPITDTLQALGASTQLPMYKKFYRGLENIITEGGSFRTAFSTLPHSRTYIPSSLQHLIVAAEYSARLPEAFSKISEIYEKKTEDTTKNLTVILEPLLLIVVWLGVMGVALAIILPIYSLIGGFNSGI